MKRFLTTVFVAAILVGCSSDDDKKVTTNATVTVKTASGVPVSGISVYSYAENAWDMDGDNDFFANAEVVTDDNGVAKFNNIEYTGAYFDSNQETYHFSAHFSQSGTNYKKSVGKTVTKGESANVQITLN